MDPQFRDGHQRTVFELGCSCLTNRIPTAAVELCTEPDLPIEGIQAQQTEQPPLVAEAREMILVFVEASYIFSLTSLSPNVTLFWKKFHLRMGIIFLPSLGLFVVTSTQNLGPAFRSWGLQTCSSRHLESSHPNPHQVWEACSLYHSNFLPSYNSRKWLQHWTPAQGPRLGLLHQNVQSKTCLPAQCK